MIGRRRNLVASGTRASPAVSLGMGKRHSPGSRRRSIGNLRAAKPDGFSPDASGRSGPRDHHTLHCRRQPRGRTPLVRRDPEAVPQLGGNAGTRRGRAGGPARPAQLPDRLPSDPLPRGRRGRGRDHPRDPRCPGVAGPPALGPDRPPIDRTILSMSGNAPPDRTSARAQTIVRSPADRATPVRRPPRPARPSRSGGGRPGPCRCGGRPCP